MDDKRDEKQPEGLDRRKFLGALGASAAAGVFLDSGGGGAKAQSAPGGPPILYQDSFGNIGPANPAALAAGLMPPPVPSQQDLPGADSAMKRGKRGHGALDEGGTYTTPTYVTDGWNQPNFLMIMVDQMGVQPARWVPSGSGGGQAALDALMPNIAYIRNHSVSFPNYFVAATACTPSRATLLTGLYSQQTCIFGTLQNQCEPGLLPYDPPTSPNGFPTIGNVLSQSLPIGTGANPTMSPGYQTVWIGKWHLSATGAQSTGCAAGVTPGPSNYGFNDTQWNIPNVAGSAYSATIAYPSPDGTLANEGCGGGLTTTPATFVYQDYDTQTYTVPPPTLSTPGYLGLSDGAIADAFSTWTILGSPTSPWFCAVSFMNPHDMSSFPYGYGLCGAYPADFTAPTGSVAGYTPPPTLGYRPSSLADYTILAMSDPETFTAAPVGSSLSGSASWNNPDSPLTLQYGPVGSAYGKPSLQYAYQNQSASQVGGVVETGSDGENWWTFLNYYYWILSNVDVQVKRVLTALEGLPQTVRENTITIFLSDHGDYAGSHSIHGKGFALYDETINVPLYIQFPSGTPDQPMQPLVLPYVCSSVDILPFIYTQALGNHSWRYYENDLVGYLQNRESINDFVFSGTPMQRRLSTISNAVTTGSYAYQGVQPYILHTTDEGFGFNYTLPGSGSPGNPVQDHAIAYRTVDYSGQPPVAPTSPYGGGKLGVYSFWPAAVEGSTLPTQTQPSGTGLANQQYEYYNYSQMSSAQLLPPNYGETGNQLQVSEGELATPCGEYLTDLNTALTSELYFAALTMPGGGAVPTFLSAAYTQALGAYQDYVYSQQTSSEPFVDTNWQT
jgi:arylsulfatase A-like enzyme